MSYEMIELRTLSPCEELEGLDLTKAPKGGHRLERTNAVRIPPGRAPLILQRRRLVPGQEDPLPPGQEDPLPPQEAGKVGRGHYFQPTSPAQYTWCDLCGDFIWGIYRKSLRCAYCSFTCHYRCRALIRLDCSRDDTDSDSDQSQDTAWEKDTNVVRPPYLVTPILPETEHYP
ncbi:unnamed protein product [Ranitomeya imitator]|uniref:Phorbol-ester/DAG-type domain-containing protein n=1 Tax=Ranitomeya imitator TaxID=111125 RepID=A0ABN9MMQ1_9NEOB|nr:unnamed protein product [Ranitomeya imitator]